MEIEKSLIERLEQEINRTPSGELRNLLTDVNIILQSKLEVNEFALGDVVGRSEQLICEHKHIMWINNDWKYFCLECGNTGIEAN